MKKTHIIWLLTVLTLLFQGCESKQVKVVARIGNQWLTLHDFELAFYRTKPIRMVTDNKIEDKKAFLEELVDREMKLQLATQLRLADIPEIAERLQEVKKRAAYIAALEQQVMYKIISNEEIRDFYEKSDLEIRVRHILLAAKGDTSKTNLDRLYEEAMEIIQSLRSGADFFELARKYSDDEFTTRKGGDLGFLKWGSMDSSFMQAALNTRRYQVFPRPVRTQKGLHVIQVMDRRKILRKPFEVAKGEIVQWLFNKYRSDILEEFRQFNERLEEENNVRFPQVNLKRAVDFFSQDLTDSLFKIHTRGRTFDPSWISSEIKDLELVLYRYQSFTITDFLYLLAKRPNPVALKQIDAEMIKKLAMDEIRLNLTAEMGFKKGYLNIPQYRDQLKDQTDRILINKLRNDFIEKENEKWKSEMQRRFQVRIYEDILHEAFNDVS